MKPEIKTRAPPPSSFINRLLDNKSSASDQAAKVTTWPTKMTTRVYHRGTQRHYDNNRDDKSPIR
jgi:hypothetical protein